MFTAEDAEPVSAHRELTICQDFYILIILHKIRGNTLV